MKTISVLLSLLLILSIWISLVVPCAGIPLSSSLTKFGTGQKSNKYANITCARVNKSHICIRFGSKRANRINSNSCVGRRFQCPVR